MNWFMAFIHHLAAFTLVAVLLGEYLLLHIPFTLENARKLTRLDMLYGLAALTLITAGLLRVFHFEKGAGYYFHSLPFLFKLGLFALVGILSIIPTREFFSWRALLAANQLPVIDQARLNHLRRIVFCELLLLVPILSGAAMTAKGIGFASY